MQAQFWVDSWALGGSKTSFHRPDIHPYIRKHLPPERLRGRRLLVPLCGKSVDLVYFREHAAHVTGVELVGAAIEQFFGEQRLPFVLRGQRYEAGRLTILHGDFFALSRADVGDIDLVYDRAALVALPLPMRRRYIAQIEALLPIGGQQFINTLEYSPILPEPPFSITPAEVAQYYGATHRIEHLEDPLCPQHRMVHKFGLRFLREHGFLLTKEAGAVDEGDGIPSVP